VQESGVNRLRAAVIGVGHLGRFHAEKLARSEGVRLVGVVDPVEDRRLRVAAECHTQPFADHRSLAGQIDAAVIAAPTRLHHDIALDLLDRGIHLLVEKPLAATAAEADDLVKAARRRRLVLRVGHVERFNPALGPLRADLADPKYMEAVRAGPFTFRSTDVGVVLDLMIHDIDLVLSLVPSRVRKIEALGLSVLGGHEDVANARLEFDSGCVAVLSASRVSCHSVRRMHVWTPRAFAAVDFAARTSTLVRPDSTLLDRRFDLDCFAPEAAEQKERLLEALLPREERHSEPVDALLLELNDFLDSVRQCGTAAPGCASVACSGEQGRDAVALAERILARIAAHAWDDQPDGLVGPLATARPSVLPSPHWQLQRDRSRRPHREAG
jgi:predicted dehydrogenase